MAVKIPILMQMSKEDNKDTIPVLHSSCPEWKLLVHDSILGRDLSNSGNAIKAQWDGDPLLLGPGQWAISFGASQ